MRALTGPAAASLLGWEGFKDHKWSSRWSVPVTCRKTSARVFRTRSTFAISMIGDLAVAHPITILRHLGECETEMAAEKKDELTPIERIEISLEYVLRKGLVKLDDLRKAVRYGRTRGDVLLRAVLTMRGDEPPAESYQEVKYLQAFRTWGIFAWRQVPVFENGRYKHRIDLLIPFDPRLPRPHVVLADSGLGVEVDSKEFHEDRFEEDHQRQTSYDMQGIHWITFTPNQLKRSPNTVRKALEQRLDAARRAQGFATHAQERKQVAKRAS